MKTFKELIRQIQDVKQRLIFISYPTRQSLEEAHKISFYWWSKNYIVICPRIMFSFMKSDRDREIIMLICKILLFLCGEFAIYGESKGCKEEYKLAKKWGKKIHILYDNDVNFKQMMQENTEVKL